ncbi:MAG: hypothetical protein RSB95_05210 [Bacilli bacterium]
MSNVRTKVENAENDYKIYSECTKMPVKENEPSLTDIMNELKSFKKETNERFVETNARLDSIDKEIKDIKYELKLIKSLPTIAKELSELE